ncbi:hypothetical protein [Xanthomonas tesorieronis]|uniref:hypothetical protein n=1 Tax=Xanthomonas tesorieronis TaxID=3160839 RepID=UPI003510EF0C
MKGLVAGFEFLARGEVAHHVLEVFDAFQPARWLVAALDALFDGEAAKVLASGLSQVHGHEGNLGTRHGANS